MVSYVNTEFFANSSITQIYFGHTSSTQYTPVVAAPELTFDPSIDSLSGTTLNLTLSQWTNVGQGPFHTLFACPSQVQGDVSLTIRGNSGPSLFGDCNNLGSVVTSSFNLGTAQVLDNGVFSPYDSSNPDHGSHIVLRATAAQTGASPWWVYSDSFDVLNGGGSSSSPTNTSDVVRPEPYSGPVLITPAITSSVPAGAKVVIPGTNLTGVISVEIGGVKATVVVNSAGELEITIPAGLATGTYDLVVVSSSGRLTVQNAITVSGSSEGTGSATPSTKRMGDGTAKVWVFDVVGAGKVQIFVNGKEIAWVNATDANDSKLFNGYLVRTIDLAEGKNIIEVFVDGERERRTVYGN
jgi:hypothetical protein